jgi:hypothetical protein
VSSRTAVPSATTVSSRTAVPSATTVSSTTAGPSTAMALPTITFPINSNAPILNCGTLFYMILILLPLYISI